VKIVFEEQNQLSKTCEKREIKIKAEFKDFIAEVRVTVFVVLSRYLARWTLSEMLLDFGISS